MKRPTEADPDGLRLVDIADERDGTTLESLSSEMARRILATVRKEPKPASEIADELDSSIQNVRYHLDNLREAELIHTVDVWYSSNGTEMDVYAPTCDALLVLTGTHQRTVAVDDLLRTAALALVSLTAVSVGLARMTTSPFRGYHSSITMEPGMLAYLRPELVFFAGGAFVLLFVAAAIALTST